MAKQKGLFAKARQKKNKMTQQELSDQMNVTRQTIINWEKGDVAPKVSDIFKLSRLLDISIDDLMNHFNKNKEKE